MVAPRRGKAKPSGYRRILWPTDFSPLAKARGIRVRSLLVVGSRFEQIPRFAKRLNCELIVLATHGRTGLGHLFVGSVAENVVHRAPCPVLTVRPSRGRR